MGFSLQVSQIAQMVCSDQDETEFLAFLHRHNVAFREYVDPSHFKGDFFDYVEFEEEDDMPAGSYVAHPEVGWSWWSRVQEHLTGLIGESATRSVRSIHAWYGVAVPIDLDPTLLGSPERRDPPTPTKPSFLQRLGIGKPKSDAVEDALRGMVDVYGGEHTNLHIVSGPRVLRELAEGLGQLGLTDADPLELYENVDEEDSVSISRCYMAMSHRFLANALEHNYLVWWRK